MSSQTDERVDLSDIDLLDDEHKHARCTFCQPDVAMLEPFVALCGVRAVHQGEGPAEQKPVNACPECEVLWHQPCRRCGA